MTRMKGRSVTSCIGASAVSGWPGVMLGGSKRESAEGVADNDTGDSSPDEEGQARRVFLKEKADSKLVQLYEVERGLRTRFPVYLKQTRPEAGFHHGRQAAYWSPSSLGSSFCCLSTRSRISLMSSTRSKTLRAT